MSAVAARGTPCEAPPRHRRVRRVRHTASSHGVVREQQRVAAVHPHRRRRAPTRCSGCAGGSKAVTCAVARREKSTLSMRNVSRMKRDAEETENKRGKHNAPYSAAHGNKKKVVSVMKPTTRSYWGNRQRVISRDAVGSSPRWQPRKHTHRGRETRIAYICATQSQIAKKKKRKRRLRNTNEG